MIARSPTDRPNPQPKKPSMATLRLRKDLQAYEESPVSFVKLLFPDEGNLQKIEVQISLRLGQEMAHEVNTPYNNTICRFLLVFPDEYPISPPKLKCLNRIYHPNINYSGSVCLPLVREDWAPTVTLSAIVCGLIYILEYPNAEDALEPEIGDQMKADFKLFNKIARHTQEGRTFRNKEYDNILLQKEP